MSDVINNETFSVSIHLGANLTNEQLPLDASYRTGIFVPVRLSVRAALTEHGLEVYGARVSGPMVKKDGTLSSYTGDADYAARVTGELIGTNAANAGMVAPPDVQAAYTELVTAFVTLAAARLAMERSAPRDKDHMTEADQMWGRL